MKQPKDVFKHMCWLTFSNPERTLQEVVIVRASTENELCQGNKYYALILCCSIVTKIESFISFLAGMQLYW